MSQLEILTTKNVLGKEFNIYGTNYEPLFLAKDVAKFIEHSKVSMMLDTIDEDEKLKETIFTSGQNREMWFLTEDGLYEVLMQSRKPIAKAFKKEVKKILKEIRVNGGYISPNATTEQVVNLIDNYSMRNITNIINDCDIMELENVVREILDVNSSSGKKVRKDSLLKKLDNTEYKQHTRKHIRKAIENRPWSNDIKNHSVEMAIRDKIIIELADNILETTNRKYGQLVNK